ncbi:MAG: hypothetical protein KKA62_03450 [Nanoarchaeota archaeon]|nr:hypothetical protein [Nanoarchaeota archaeon]MBU1644583.1 hypothetical protein [Nanoarchaeota archaeon]MBU1976981.1 hypothetical protein [Nanoarchaeota archaeon]
MFLENRESSDWQKRWDKHNNERLKRFRKKDGSFDIQAYSRSDLAQEKKELLDGQLSRRIGQDLNRSIGLEVNKHISKINMTKYAREKTNYLIQEFKNIRKKFNLCSYELALFLLAGNGQSTIDDVYLAQDQQVTPTYCDVTVPGTVASFKDIRDNLEKKIIGWGHSHAEMPPFYSETDDNTMYNRFRKWHNKEEINYSWAGRNLSAGKLKYFYGMVFNEKQDFPALRVIAEKPKIVPVPGKLFHYQTVRENLDLEGRSPQEWLKENIIDDGKIISEEEKLELNQQLLERVSVETKKGYVKLSNFNLSNFNLNNFNLNNFNPNQPSQSSQPYQPNSAGQEDSGKLEEGAKIYSSFFNPTVKTNADGFRNIFSSFFEI